MKSKSTAAVINQSSNNSENVTAYTMTKRALRSLRDLIARFLKKPDMTLEQWEQLEKKHSPHSSHHGQIYLRERW